MTKQTREQQLDKKERDLNFREELTEMKRELFLLCDRRLFYKKHVLNNLRRLDALRRENVALRQTLFKLNVEKEVKLRLLKIEEEMLVINNQSEKEARNETTSAIMSAEVESSRDEKTEHRMVESELCCGVCSDLIVFATTLNCMHTFCSHCIKRWKEYNTSCPVCRSEITSETRNPMLDNVVGIVTKFQTEEEKKYRKGLVQQHSISTVFKKFTSRPFSEISLDQDIEVVPVDPMINALPQVSVATSVSGPPVLSNIASSNSSVIATSGVRPRIARPRISSGSSARPLQSATCRTDRPRWRY